MRHMRRAGTTLHDGGFLRSRSTLYPEASLMPLPTLRCISSLFRVY